MDSKLLRQTGAFVADRGKLFGDIGPFTQAIFAVQLSAIFFAPKLQLQDRTCKLAAISWQF